LRPEEKARNQIDELLEKAGWAVMDYKDLNLGASLGVAIREFPLGQIYADYLLFVDRKAVGVIEAKQIGTTLSGVAEQSQSYITHVPDSLPCYSIPLPFAYESTGIETFFRDIRDLDARSRRVFAFHTPETLYEWLSETNTLRTRLKNMKSENVLIETGLRDCQIQAIKNLEQSFAENRPRSLIQMATGTGKTYTAVSFVYRLIKFAKAKRILFLVDRKTLGRQALKEFQGYVSPDDGRKFIELYNAQNLRTNKIDPVNKVVITTIQRLYSMLRGEREYEEELEETSSFEDPSLEYLDKYQKPKEVSYNPDIPIETFDFIITDECHRSIYHLWRQTLEYFDAFIIGLTATPSKQTIGFFNSNLVMKYPHEMAVADGVNVGYEVYRISTEVTEKGSKVEAGNFVDKRDKGTRKVRWEKLDADLEYKAKQLDRSVVTPDQIRTIIRTFKEKLPTEIFPGRTEVPKTLIFAKDDSHAEDIVHIIREEFGRGNEFCKKITYKTHGDKPEDLIASFRNSYYPRIAVTVDMIATGTDIKPLECLIFMRDVKSSLYFEQMKGRGTRVIKSDDFNAVTPDAKDKTHFVIVDAVGVCESIKSDSTTLERKKGVSFEKLLSTIAIGYSRDEDTLTTLGNRIARLDRKLEKEDRQEIEKASGGKPVKELVKNLIETHDPDVHIEKAKELFNVKEDKLVTEEQIKKVRKKLVEEACKPFDNALLRNTLIEIKKKNEQTIDTVTIDTLLSAGYDSQAKEKSKSMIKNFEKFIEENKNEIDALQIIYNKSYKNRHLTYEEIKKLAEAIKKPPYLLDTDKLWNAYEQLEKSKSRRKQSSNSSKRMLTDIISLIRFAIGQQKDLEPFSESVHENFKEWLEKQERLGKKFTKEQLEWLKMIKNHIATSLSVSIDDFEFSPFYDEGGAVKIYQLFGDDLNSTMNELNEVLIQ
jgi:type I restriction enzyme, R subunit